MHVYICIVLFTSTCWVIIILMMAHVQRREERKKKKAREGGGYQTSYLSRIYIPVHPPTYAQLRIIITPRNLNCKCTRYKTSDLPHRKSAALAHTQPIRNFIHPPFFCKFFRGPHLPALHAVLLACHATLYSH